MEMDYGNHANGQLAPVLNAFPQQPTVHQE